MFGFESYTRFLFFIMGLLALGALATARYIQDSFLGQGLRAVRDSEEAAECSGVPTLKLKLIACGVSGVLLGAAGAQVAPALAASTRGFRRRLCPHGHLPDPRIRHFVGCLAPG